MGRGRRQRGPSLAQDDHYGTETVDVARSRGVPDARMTTTAAQIYGIVSSNGASAAPDALEKVARLIETGRLRVPIAASFRMEKIRAAVELQAGRHVKGKVVIDI